MRYAALLLALLLPMKSLALSPTQAVAVAAADADASNIEDTPFYLYFYDPRGTVPAFETALRLHVNQISREALLAYPTLIAPGVWRADRRNYQWSKQFQDSLAAVDPYFHRLVSQDVVEETTVDQPYGIVDAYGRWHQTEIRRERREVKRRVSKNVLFVPLGATRLAGLAFLTQSAAPIVRADWFLAQSIRQFDLHNRDNTGTGYYDALELNTLQDYLDLVGLNVRTSDRIETEIRAVVRKSRVAAQNRQIVRRGAQSGPEWQTLEVENQSGRGIAIQNLRDGELLFVAQERYGRLPNGLPVTFLANGQGVRQSSVPDLVAGDKSALNLGNDTRVHVNKSCMGCHAGGVLQPVDEAVRYVYTGRLRTNTGSKEVDLELARQYSQSFDQALADDRSIFQRALTRATKLEPQKAAETYVGAFNTYVHADVTLQMAATELGVSPAALQKSLADAAFRLGRGDFRTDAFLTVPPQTIPRLDWEDAFQTTQDALFGVLQP
jgi:hypothetical protein